MNSKTFQKRIWVKTPNGLPTSIMTSEADIVDDIKSAVCRKFPNTIANVYDSSEVRILVRRSPERDQIRSKNQSKTTSSGKVKSDHINGNKATGNLSSNSSYLISLEPDKGVWDALKEFYGGEMKMSEAFLIETRDESELGTSSIRPCNCQSSLKNVPRASQKIYSSSPTYFDESGNHSRSTNLFSPNPHKPLRDLKGWDTEKSLPESPKIFPEQATSFLSHKRSQSSPSHTPVSSNPQQSTNAQAVLLLPKNFSLSERHSSKTVSSTERETQKGPRSTTNDSSAIDSMNAFDRKHAQGTEHLQPAHNTIPGGNSEKSTEFKTAALDKGNTEPSSHDATDSFDQSDTPKFHTKSGEISGRTLNTSTFEQVLPSISVLVVEDNSINQAILGAFLRRHKIHYQIAKNGQEAVDKWRNGGFHLVLMDIQLPVKSGIEATKEIRLLERVNRIGVFAQHELTSNQASSLPKIKEEDKLDLGVFRSPVIIVALTASSNSSVDRKNALTAGCNDFLTKPVNLVWLQNKITEWGCMQALIDFDGWRCKGTTNTSVSSNSRRS